MLTTVCCRQLLERVPQAASRLMLILDYMLHNFYDPPAELQEQVE